MEKEKQPEDKVSEQCSEAGQFTGIPLENLIGGPLRAAVEAQAALAGTTAEFIRRVGFPETEKAPHTVTATCKDGQTIEVPLLSIVPIPDLRINEINVSFDMEVREAEQGTSAGKPQNFSAAFFSSGNKNFDTQGNTSAHTQNSRSENNSPKHGIEIQHVDQNMPKGLEKVLEILSKALAPEPEKPSGEEE